MLQGLQEQLHILPIGHAMAISDLLTAAAVSDRLGIDRSTVYRMAADGRLPAVKVGTQWRFVPSALDEVLADGAISDVLPGAGAVSLRTARESVLRAVAPMLDVMMVVTDMQGHLLTDVVNPCMWFRQIGDDPDRLAACTVQWQRMASDVEFTPRLEVGSHGFACARSFVRHGNELVGLVVAGGVAPEDLDRGAAVDAGLYFLDERARARLLTELPRVAAAISDLTAPRPSPPTSDRSAR